MKCKKCGATLVDGDLFCFECGTKVESEDVIETNVEQNPVEEETVEVIEERKISSEQDISAVQSKGKKKKGIMIGILFVVVIAAVAFFLIPKETEIEAKDLAALMYSDEVENYKEDTFIVHGLLVVDTRSWTDNDGYYSLCQNLEEENPDNVVMFKYEPKVGEDVGTGSEVIVTGTIDKDGMYLNATEVEVINKVDPVFVFNDVDAMLEAANDITNKKITVTGLLDNSFDDGVLLLNDAEDNGAILKNLANPKDMQYGTYTIVGTFYLEDGISTIDVEKFELIEAMVKVPHFESIRDLFDEAAYYRDATVSVNGMVRIAGSTGYLVDGDLSLELRGMSQEDAYNLTGEYVTVTGILKGGVGDPYCLLFDRIGE